MPGTRIPAPGPVIFGGVTALGAWGAVLSEAALPAARAARSLRSFAAHSSQRFCLGFAALNIL
jgi:hypothetical protein